MTKISRKAGVVAYRKNEERGIEVLLVSSRRYPGTWVFPVGGIDEGETAEEAAARECVEESGYIVEIEEELDTVKINDGEITNEFTFYSAEVVEETEDYEKDRTRKWVKPSELEGTVVEVFIPIARKFLDSVE